jgi:hypothetical protein
MEANFTPKNPKIFECKICNFITSNKKDYNRHLLTRKHVKEANGSNFYPKKPLTKMVYNCEFCNKEYRSRGSLWKHERNCSKIPNEEMKNESINVAELNTTDSIMELIKQNQDFKSLIIEQQKENQTLQKQLIEAVKDTGNIYNNTTNTTNNTQKFNLNFFLNTTCKDAMNMSEFIENINIDLQELEDIGKNGYVAGMTNMILSRIKDMDVTKRPLHCTDLKRETMYIKDNNEWSKDTPENTKLKKMITIVAKQNYNTVPLWRKKHPECEDWNNPKYDFCIDMMRNILGDMGDEQIKLDNKVIKNLSRHILVEKN